MTLLTNIKCLVIFKSLDVFIVSAWTLFGLVSAGWGSLLSYQTSAFNFWFVWVEIAILFGIFVSGVALLNGGKLGRKVFPLLIGCVFLWSVDVLSYYRFRGTFTTSRRAQMMDVLAFCSLFTLLARVFISNRIKANQNLIK